MQAVNWKMELIQTVTNMEANYVYYITTTTKG